MVTVQTEPNAKTKLLQALPRLQMFVVIAYAISLPLSMTASWALLTAGIVLTVLEMLITRSLEPLRQPLAAPLLAVALAAFVSGYCAGGLLEALRSVQKLQALLVYFWAANTFKQNRELGEAALLSLLFVGAVGGIWGTIQQIFNIHPGYKYLQGTGFLAGPMAFAGQMQIFSMVATGLFVAICIAARKTPRTDPGDSSATGLARIAGRLKHPVMIAVYTVCNLAGLVFAGERSAWLGGIAGLAVLSGLMSLRALLSSALAFAIVCAVGWYTVPLVHTRMASLMSLQQDVSVRVRLQIWDIALAEWKKSPIVGIGFLKFPHLDIPEAIVPGVSKDLNHAHSNYMQFLATTGVIGLAAYLWLCIAQVSNAFAVIRASKRIGDTWFLGVSRGVLAAVVALMVSGLFEYNFGTAQVRLVQWFLLAFLVLPATKSPKRSLVQLEKESDQPQSHNGQSHLDSTEPVDPLAPQNV